MKIMVTGMASRDSLFGTRQVERLLSWLGGVDTHALSIAEELISQNLPHGITIQHASAEQLGHATKAAMESRNQQAEAIVKFVFSSLTGHDGAKGEAVIRSVFQRFRWRAFPSLSELRSEHAHHWR